MTIEDDLKRLIEKCPEIVLEKLDIETILNGNTDQIINEYKNEMETLSQMKADMEFDYLEEELTLD